ncbi:MAG TPA: hypothetical protein VFM85_04080 [Actinomycetota bacterium]|nr:hypothetical protein [Actinomycetota bacterium]
MRHDGDRLTFAIHFAVKGDVFGDHLGQGRTSVRELAYDTRGGDSVADIEVRRASGENFVPRFGVTVRDEDGSTSVHEVTVSLADFERLGRNFRELDEFVRACFQFLLERESKELILPSFDVAMISSYFPEFEDRISRSSPI